MFAALAEFERELIRERTKAGMAAARRRGKHVGRPRKLTPYQVAEAKELIGAGKKSRADGPPCSASMWRRCAGRWDVELLAEHR